MTIIKALYIICYMLETRLGGGINGLYVMGELFSGKIQGCCLNMQEASRMLTSISIEGQNVSLPDSLTTHPPKLVTL